jgi:hypothetical protein
MPNSLRKSTLTWPSSMLRGGSIAWAYYHVEAI